MKTKLTIHKVAQIDRVLSGSMATGELTRVNNAMMRGEMFAKKGSEQSVQHHGYLSAWYRVVSLNLQTT